MAGGLAGWCADWLAGWLACCLASWLVLVLLLWMLLLLFLLLKSLKCKVTPTFVYFVVPNALQNTVLYTPPRFTLPVIL